MAKVSTTELRVFTCVACKSEVTATVDLTFELDGDIQDNGYVTMTGKINGLRVNHDCIPKVTR